MPEVGGRRSEVAEGGHFLTQLFLYNLCHLYHLVNLLTCQLVNSYFLLPLLTMETKSSNQTIIRQAVEVGGIYFAAVTTDIAVTQVVGHDNNNIGAASFFLCRQTAVTTPKNDQ